MLLLRILILITLILGFISALSLVRALSTPFNWYANPVYGNFASFSFISSVVIFITSMVVNICARWSLIIPKNDFPNPKIEFSVLLLFCSAVFFALRHIMVYGNNMIINFNTVILLFPILAYLAAYAALSEFVVRTRKKTLLNSLYWYLFFKTYPLNGIVGVMGLFLLCSMLINILFPTISVFIFSSLIYICITYFLKHHLSLSKEFEKANEEKIRAERFKSELITNVSHDIKTPLTSIINYIDLLKKEVVQGQAAEYVNVLDKKSKRLKALIDDLMEASKAGTRNVSVNFEEINLSEIIGQIAGEFEENFRAKNLNLVLRQPNESIFTKTDSRHLYRVLENILSNASKYSLGGTRVFVETSLLDDKAFIVVQNTSENPIEISNGEATEQFMRGDKSRQTEGSGLGLYIAKSLIEIMGGRFEIIINGDLFRVEIAL